MAARIRWGENSLTIKFSILQNITHDLGLGWSLWIWGTAWPDELLSASEE